MDEIVEKYKKEIYNSKTGNYDLYYLDIYQDESPVSPRENDNLTEIISYSRQYCIGDNQITHDSYFSSWSAVEDAIKESVNNILFISPFSHYNYGCNGEQIYLEDDIENVHIMGFVYITLDRVKELCGDDSKYHDLNWLYEAAKGEIHTYNQWLQGDVYGFITYKEEICPCCNTTLQKETDSVWGFFGHNWEENNLFDNANWYNCKLNKIETNK